MNYSAIFSNAHATAKHLMTIGLFPSYRAAFSKALSDLMSKAWSEHKAVKAAKSVFKKVKMMRAARISNAAARAMKDTAFFHNAIFDEGGVYIAIRNTPFAHLSMSMSFNGGVADYVDVTCLNAAKQEINKWANARIN